MHRRGQGICISIPCTSKRRSRWRRRVVPSCREQRFARINPERCAHLLRRARRPIPDSAHPQRRRQTNRTRKCSVYAVCGTRFPRRAVLFRISLLLVPQRRWIASGLNTFRKENGFSYHVISSSRARTGLCGRDDGQTPPMTSMPASPKSPLAPCPLCQSFPTKS